MSFFVFFLIQKVSPQKTRDRDVFFCQTADFCQFRLQTNDPCYSYKYVRNIFWCMRAGGSVTFNRFDQNPKTTPEERICGSRVPLYMQE